MRGSGKADNVVLALTIAITVPGSTAFYNYSIVIGII
jgi:hypothetical protein